MEFKKTSPGYPCSSYIISKIKTTDELWIYAKTFVQSAMERGLTSSDIILRLTASFSTINIDSGIIRPNLTELGTNDDERCQYLLTNPLVGHSKSCETLYRKIDSHTGACRLCQYSKLYRNAHEDREYALLKFMLKNESNLNYVADRIDEEFFESCLDVSMGIPVQKAYVLPMCKILVQSLLKNNIRLMIFSSLKETFFITGEPYDVVWEDAYRTFPRNRKIPVSLSNNPMWQNVLKNAIKEKIMGSVDLTKEDVNEIFNDYVLNGLSISTIQNNSVKIPKEEPKQLLLEDIIVKMQPPKVKGEETINNLPNKTSITSKEDVKVNQKETDLPKTSIDESVISVDEPVLEHLVSPTNEINIDSSFENMEEPTEYFSADSDKDIPIEPMDDISHYEEMVAVGNKTAPVSASSEMIAQKTAENTSSAPTAVAVLEPPTTTNEPGDSSMQETAATTTSTTPSFTSEPLENETNKMSSEVGQEEVLKEEEIYLLNERNLILQTTLPDSIRKKGILHIRKNKKFPAAFYQGVIRDKQLFVEVVRGEDGRYLYLMWSRHMKKFLTISLTDATDEMKRLLSYKSIKKICHTPYVLYGASKLYHLTVKNVFSLQTVYGRLFPSSQPLHYTDFCKTLEGKTLFGAYIKKEACELCPFLGGMPMYREFHNTFINMIQTHGAYSMFVKDSYLDEALGCSYYYGLNFVDKGTLFLMVGNNQFFFTKDYYHKTVTEGRCFGYFIKEDIDVVALFQYILQRLAEKGIFRTTNLQLLGMDKKQLQLFVEKEQEPYMATLIDMLAFEYGKAYLSKPLTLHNVIYEI